MISKTIEYYRKNGFVELLKAIYYKLRFEISRVGHHKKKAEDFIMPELKKIEFIFIKRSNKKRRVTLVIPSLEKKHFFAGAWTAMLFAWEFKAKYNLRFRVICTDGEYDVDVLRGLNFTNNKEADLVESWTRDSEDPCEIEGDEIIIVTAWWTAELFKELQDKNKIVYLVQDFEPGFYPWSYRYLAALNTYGYKYIKVFNTSLLYDYFKNLNLLGDQGSYYFEPGIDRKLHFPSEKNDYKETGKVRILVYGRMDTPRNMFELIVLSFERFFEKYPEEKEKILEIVSVGSPHPKIIFSDGTRLESKGKLTLAEWSALTRKSNVGISLMCSPHPSYPPLEMISSGMIVLTNSFAGKDLSKMNGNFLTVDPTPEAISLGIKRAIEMSKEQEKINKYSGDYLDSHRWENCFDETLLSIGHNLGLK